MSPRRNRALEGRESGARTTAAGGAAPRGSPSGLSAGLRPGPAGGTDTRSAPRAACTPHGAKRLRGSDGDPTAGRAAQGPAPPLTDVPPLLR